MAVRHTNWIAAMMLVAVSTIASCDRGSQEPVRDAPTQQRDPRPTGFPAPVPTPPVLPEQGTAAQPRARQQDGALTTSLHDGVGTIQSHALEHGLWFEPSCPGSAFSGVRSIDFSRDATRMVAAIGNRCANLYRLGSERGSVVHEVSFGHSETPMETKLSPDGTRLAVRTLSGSIVLWQLEQRTAKIFIEPPSGRDFESVAWSPDGDVLMTGESTRQHAHDKAAALRFYRANDGTLIESFELGTYDTGEVSFSDDERYILHSHPADSSELYVRDRRTGALVKTLKGHSAASHGYFSRHGPRVVSRSNHWNKVGEVFLWDIPSGKRRCSYRYEQKLDLIRAALLWSNDRYLIGVSHLDRLITKSISNEATLTVIDAQTCKRVTQIGPLKTEVSQTSLTVSPDDRWIAFGGTYHERPGPGVNKLFLIRGETLVAGNGSNSSSQSTSATSGQ